MQIIDAPLDEWLLELKPYQSKTIAQLVQENGAEEAVGLWLSANGPTATIQFGGKNESNEPFLEKFKGEFRKFVCGDSAYDKFRNQFSETSIADKSMYISVISAALGAALGYSATLLAPAIVIMLHLVGTMGVNAWCKPATT